MAGRLIKRLMSSKTALYDVHIRNGAKFETKNNFWLPRSHENVPIVDEYFLCKNKAVIYDQGNMGQVIVTGKDRAEFINWISVADFLCLYQGRHSMVLNDNGEIVDRIIIAHFDDKIRVVTLNKNTEKHIYECREKFNRKGKNVELEIPDESFICLQGVKSKQYLSQALRQIKSDSFIPKRCYIAPFKAFNNENSFITWLDFSQQSGFLISMKTEKIPMLVDFFQLLSQNQIQIAGLESQRMLRIEAGYWNEEELIEPLNPIEANWVFNEVKLKTTDWIGGEAIKQLLLKEDHDKLVKFELNGIFYQLQGSNIFDGFKKHAGTILSIVYNTLTKKTIGFCKIKHKYLAELKKLYIVGEVPITIIK